MFFRAFFLFHEFFNFTPPPQAREHAVVAVKDAQAGYRVNIATHRDIAQEQVALPEGATGTDIDSFLWGGGVTGRCN